MCVTLFGKIKIDCKYFKERFYLQFCLKVMDEKVVGFGQCFQVFFKSVTEKECMGINFVFKGRLQVIYQSIC